ncbi:ester cyclase [Nocardia terpenica]|uniref:Ester cyclase n=1 Tax=Nocardia terpenica TaxID=455432 RepID=A0A291RFN3_9NOCA|nr:ester cyclase [Nocardia terpenica]ATL66411.1 hypothetical protein CRH09_09530 [Nocardia terpenica]
MTEATQRPYFDLLPSFDALRRRDLGDAPWWDDDSVYDLGSRGIRRGRTEIRGYFDEMLCAFPDFDIEIHRVVTEGSSRAVQWEAVGTFTGGPFQGVSPTGTRVTFHGLDLIEFDGPVIRSCWEYSDPLSFARQVGLVPADNSAADAMLRGAFNVRTRLGGVLRRPGR